MHTRAQHLPPLSALQVKLWQRVRYAGPMQRVAKHLIGADGRGRARIRLETPTLGSHPRISFTQINPQNNTISTSLNITADMALAKVGRPKAYNAIHVRRGDKLR